MLSDTELDALARAVGERLAAQGLLLCTAESCTGGWVAQAITAVAGSSTWFDRGFVTYSNASKTEMLGVAEEQLHAYGAVSQPVVREMALGALRHSRAQVGLAVSGIAGPGGGSLDKPVGMVWHAWAVLHGPTHVELRHYSGNRPTVRRAAVQTALQGVLEILTSAPKS
jgi:nicotinamide-nucleotide amidase